MRAERRCTVQTNSHGRGSSGAFKFRPAIGNRGRALCDLKLAVALRRLINAQVSVALVPPGRLFRNSGEHTGLKHGELAIKSAAVALTLILHIQLRHLHYTKIHVNLETVRDVARDELVSSMKNLGEDKSKMAALGSQRMQAI